MFWNYKNDDDGEKIHISEMDLEIDDSDCFCIDISSGRARLVEAERLKGGSEMEDK